MVTFQALLHPDSLTLRVPAQFGGGTRRLSSVRAARGTKYESGDVMVWRKGSSATIEIDGQRLQACTLAPQTESGEEEHSDMQFRAIGQEPGWLLEISDDSLRFAWSYGQHEVTASRPERDTSAGRILYVAETDRGTVHVEAKPQECTDPMNGRLFSHTVTVTLTGDTHTGCGRPVP